MSGDRRNRLDVVSRGDLEDITKPSSSRSRTGSRVTSSQLGNSSATSTASRLRPQVAAALELLTPEEVMDQDFDLALEEYGSSEYTSDEDDLEEATGRTSEIFRIAEPLKQVDIKTQMEEDYAASRQLTLVGSLLPDDETEMDSEEENGIMKEIRAEITAQIREEMKDELEVYHKKREALTSAPGVEKPGARKEDEDEEMDPKLKEAILKMRKLDRILGKKIKREKEVKRERILLQRRLRDELANLKQEDGSQESHEVKTNTAKFLALTLPPSHNAGVSVDEAGDAESPLPSVTPVFQTQVIYDRGTSSRGTTQSKSDTKSHQGTVNNGQGATTCRSDTSRGGATSQGATTEETGSTFSGATSSTNLTGKSTGKTKRGKNFIKRNVQLASDAANLIAMTEEEKCRVDNLLIGVDSLSDIPEEQDREGALSNPFQVALVEGDGFFPAGDEQRRLAEIDSRLKMLLPTEDFQSIASTPLGNNTPQQESVLFTRTALDTEGPPPLLGEQALIVTREHRDVQRRLQEIERELNSLSSAVENEIESPTLTADQLENLLDQCAITMHCATTETDSLANSERTLVTSRASLYDNPPRLEESILQELLVVARRDLRISSSQANTPRAETRNGSIGQGDPPIEAISEDTIKELLQNSRSTSRASTRTARNTPSNVHNVRSETQPITASQDRQYQEQTISHTPSGNVLYGGPEDRRHPGLESDRNKSSFHSNSTGNIHRTMWNHDNMNLTSFDEDEMHEAMISNGFSQRNGDRRPFLPEIDPKGTLITRNPPHNQGLSSDEFLGRRSSGSKASGILNQNYVLEQNSSCHIDSGSDHSGRNTPTPHPPQSGRPSSGSAGKHRSIVGLGRAAETT